jgi:hypothetical protein
MILYFFVGVLYIEATDDTFIVAGKIGLWSLADSVSYFDDLRVAARLEYGDVPLHEP